jgi:hypothetical protein
MTIENNSSKTDLTISVEASQAALRGDLDLSQAILFLDYEISSAQTEFIRARMSWVREFVVHRTPSLSRDVGEPREPVFPVRGSRIPHCVVDWKDGKPILDFSAPPTSRISTGSEFVNTDSAEGQAVLASLGR